MKIPYLIILCILLSLLSCKKDKVVKPDPEKPVSAVPLPDSVLFVNTVDQTSGATVLFVLNAATGASVTKYTYPADAGTTWSYPVTGNDLLYTLQTHKINAINMATGKLVWTDALNNALTPILHQQTFFGVKQENTTSYEAYALDATRQTNDFLWKYKLPGAPVQLNYYNGVVYVLTDVTHLTALDAKTGTAKWSVAAAAPLSLNAINDGAFIAGNTIYNAATGVIIGTAGTINIPLFYGAGTIVRSQLLYATPTVCYIKTGHYRPSAYSGYDFNQDFLSVVDIASGTEKQRIKFGEGYILVPTTNVITQMWNNKLIISQTHSETAKFYGYLASSRYGILPADLSSELVTFEQEQRGVSSEYLIAGNRIFYFKVYWPASGITPFVPGTPNLFLSVNLLTGQQQWSSDKSFDDTKGPAMSACVYTGGKGFSKYIQ
ncbi:PQQ-binding-like beta-propeller repeat protein [Mucilaginibacter robiniae]|uniref:PQQ-binding-like beta-propeller repeat protein n=1 Tax=Mucilaginibacter robiniae TaxID=2728022 RepID=A0A7L5E1D4_9SPHI|nr:PQQ-binding-like beta-propeller repeat protein [Mucilaginibacter robiniae]QJD94633.1 PQQ-binding-like beta-propeller repeat protein [Mucilaginibacter robiniae]